ncbi:MAG: hypothetical protein ACYTE6_00915 [Planctomycetota bacterium]|jgi:hypothetical protein
MTAKRFRIAFGARAALLAGTLVAGCTSPVPVDDPQAALAQPNLSMRKHLGAMEALDAQPDDPAYVQELSRIIYRPGYTVNVREAAFERLAAHDPEALKKTIRQHLPRLGARAWHARLCELIAQRQWTELTPALVSSWAQPIGFVDDMDRPEYEALARLHGRDHVLDAVFRVLVESTKPYQMGLRGRCWELLQRLGQRERLLALLVDESVDPDDLMIADLRAAAIELRVVPRTREEVLWVRELRQPQHADFWSQAVAAVGGLSEARLMQLELRDLPILVAASIHDPWLLAAGESELYGRVAAHTAASQLHIDPDRFLGFPGSYQQRLVDHRNVLTWGDLSAMLLAVRAMEVPQVVAHLFDYADRDHEDRTCEYGGVIRLDEQGRFEIQEFPPRFRRRDNEFIASQEMMDASYTAVFHFHFHVQKHRNGRYASPGLGDLNYADNTRANCLVLTFINRDTLNVDFYRYGRVIVDLGEVGRP